MMKPQLELTFQHPAFTQVDARRQRRRRTAQWWFEQMRRVVDRALDRGHAPSRPEQIYFSLNPMHPVHNGRG